MKKRIIVLPLLVGMAFQTCGCQKADSINASASEETAVTTAVLISETETTTAPFAITETIIETELVIVYANPISVKIYDAEGNVTGTVENEYDSSGNKAKRTNRNQEGKTIAWSGFEYDSAGNCIKQTDYDSNNDLIRYTKFEYDESGNQTKRSMYGTHDSLLVMFEYNYDKTGKIIKETKKALDYINSWKNYEYNEFGNVEKVTTYSDDYTVRCWSDYEYDQAGNVIKIVEYLPDGEVSYEFMAEYDSEGNRIKEVAIHYDINAKSTESYEMAYDDTGRLLSVTCLTPDGTISSRTEYTY
ncbi:MAG: hypothetical protein IKE92_06940 [Clostridiales bacterium]|nr:hypothetical protein [Clostridiales bacterium]MBR3248022.1 hypothetical protein [Clostridiales bacterium]